MTYIDVSTAEKYQDFFNFMADEHGLILTNSEMDDIISKAQDVVKKFDEQAKNEHITDVSKQRKLLKAFQEYYQNNKFDDERTFDWNIANFIKETLI